MAANPTFGMLMPCHTVTDSLIDYPSSICNDIVTKAIRVSMPMQFGEIDLLQFQEKIHGFFPPFADILSVFPKKQIMIQFIQLTIN